MLRPNTKKYVGVGGHIFAIAAELSEKHGFEGYVYGEAMDEDLFLHYHKKYNAAPLPKTGPNPYRFMLSAAATKEIREVYDYEWSNDVP